MEIVNLSFLKFQWVLYKYRKHGPKRDIRRVEKQKGKYAYVLQHGSGNEAIYFSNFQKVSHKPKRCVNRQHTDTGLQSEAISSSAIVSNFRC